MLFVSVKYAPLIAVGVALALAGCGSSSDSSAATSGHTGGSAITKAAFIKKADAICKKSDDKQTADVEAHLKKSGSSKVEEIEVVKKFGLPPIQVEAEELGDLEVPAGDEAKIEAIVKGIEEALAKAEANPYSVIVSIGPFGPVGKLAGEYGFKVCNSPA